MKKTFKYMTLAAAAMLTAACSQNELFTSYQDDPNAVQITAQVGEGDVNGGFVTRSTPAGGTTEEEGNFKSGDRISVSTADQDPVVYAFDGTTTWTPENSKFLRWTSPTMTFTAFYPVTEATDAKNFALPADQSSLEAIAKADNMTCSSSETRAADNNGVTLAMQRKMARIVISPDIQNQFEGWSISEIKIYGNSKGYSGGIVNTDGSSVEVKAYKHTDDKFYALLSPTTVDANSTFIEVTVTHRL